GPGLAAATGSARLTVLPATVDPAPGRSGHLTPFQVLRRPLLTLPLYLPGSLIGLMATLPLQSGLQRYSQSAPWLGPLPRVDRPAGLVDLLGKRAANEALGEAPSAELLRFGLTVLGSLATLALGVLVQGLVYSFVCGGLLARLRGESGTFWRHCR